MEIIAADIGGTHIAAASVIWAEGKAGIQAKAMAEVDTSLSVDELISAWSGVIRQVTRDKSDICLGIAMPGPFDYERGISLIEEQGKMKSLFGLSVKNLLAKELGIPPLNIRFVNDAESFLKGESLVGAGKELQSLLGITLGTGLGSAIQIQGVTKDAKLWTAPFREGIAEDYLGTGWFKNWVKKMHGIELSGAKDLLDKGFDTKISSTVFREFGKTLGEFLLPYVNRLQTQKVILGGKITGAGELFIPWTRAYLDQFGVRVPIEISVL